MSNFRFSDGLYKRLQQVGASAIPDATATTVRASLLDIIGIIAGARLNETSQLITRYSRTHYPPGQTSARLFFDGTRVSPLGAAWVGGFMADSLDAHEGHFTSKGHAGATVVPALLSLVDAHADGGRALSGQAFLMHLTLAYETALRAGVALMNTASDYHASGAFTGLGVVCGGAPLLDLTDTQFHHALGIAEYFGPRCPMMRLIDHPSMLRDAHGAGAFAGVNALYLAESGLTGAPALSVVDDRVAAYWSDFGDRWEIDRQYFKPWPVCRWAQPALTAVEAILRDHPDVQPSSIRRIRVETFHESMRLQGHRPADADEAQYALAFPLAARIVRGRLGPEEVTGNALQDPDILALSDRIEIVEAGDLSARFPHALVSRVTVEQHSGEHYASGDQTARGDPDNPLTDTELREKFYRLGSTTLSDSRLSELEDCVDNLASSPDCTALLNLIFRPDEHT